MDLFHKYRSEVLDPDYFSLLFDPEFVKIDGHYFLSAHFSQESLSTWLENPIRLREPKKLENTINHVHLDDLFEDHERQLEVGSILQKRWSDNLSNQFPDQQFEILLSPLADGGWELQMWAKRDNLENNTKTQTD